MSAQELFLSRALPSASPRSAFRRAHDYTRSLQVRERLLILPIIGVLDSERARQLTQQLLAGIRAHRAKVVVIDTTGLPDVGESVANPLVQTVDASRLMGASVIITGLSAEIARSMPPGEQNHKQKES